MGNVCNGQGTDKNEANFSRQVDLNLHHQHVELPEEAHN
jgi:hypothetical protein